MSALTSASDLRRVGNAALAASPALQQCSQAMAAMAKAAREAPMPTLGWIAGMRLLSLKAEFGFARFLLPDWYRWKWIRLTMT